MPGSLARVPAWLQAPSPCRRPQLYPGRTHLRLRPALQEGRPSRSKAHTLCRVTPGAGLLHKTGSTFRCRHLLLRCVTGDKYCCPVIVLVSLCGSQAPGLTSSGRSGQFHLGLPASPAPLNASRTSSGTHESQENPKGSRGGGGKGHLYPRGDASAKPVVRVRGDRPV